MGQARFLWLGTDEQEPLAIVVNGHGEVIETPLPACFRSLDEYLARAQRSGYGKAQVRGAGRAGGIDTARNPPAGCHGLPQHLRNFGATLYLLQRQLIRAGCLDHGKRHRRDAGRGRHGEEYQPETSQWHRPCPMAIPPFPETYVR